MLAWKYVSSHSSSSSLAFLIHSGGLGGAQWFPPQCCGVEIIPVWKQLLIQPVRVAVLPLLLPPHREGSEGTFCLLFPWLKHTAA